MPEYLLVGWEEIHKMFCDKDGKPVKSFNNFTRTWGKEMLKLGLAFKLHIGKGKKVTVCTWPSLVRRYMMLKQQQKEL